MVIGGNVFSYRSQILWSFISMLCAAGLWLVLYWGYGKGTIRNNTPRFEPVGFLVGILFVATGVWGAIKFLPTQTVTGSLSIGVFALLPICCGLVIIRNQLLLRRISSRTTTHDSMPNVLF